MAAFLRAPQPVAWLEVHSENYLCEGGPRLAQLARIRADYPLSCHGVGLSLGSADGLDGDHLARLRALYDRFEPALVSDHLSWSVNDGVFANDLLPLPMTEEALAVACRNVERAQAALGRRLAVENPSTYLEFVQSTIPEAEFLAALAQRSGCALLFDVNNLHVSAANHGWDVDAYLEALPGTAIVEYHLAGHARLTLDGALLLVDDHGSRVDGAVWDLFDRVLRRFGPRPTLIEWDTAVPALETLLDEAARAQAMLTPPSARIAHAG